MFNNPNTNPSVDDVERYNTDQLIEYLQGIENLNFKPEVYGILRNQEVNGSAFVKLTDVKLERWGMLGGPATNIMRLIDELNSQNQPGTTETDRIRDENLNKYWNAIKRLKIGENDLFLELPEDVHILGNPEKPSISFIRKCYRDLETVVLDSEARRIRITGNPGIGKTYFGYYLLCLLAQRGGIILYENFAMEASYIFDGENAFRTYNTIITDSYKIRRDVWYIVDGKEPKEVNAKTVLVCSPKKTHFTSFDKFGTVEIRFMPEWSLDEIHACRARMFSNISKEKVDQLFFMWGGIPRFVLEYANNIVQQNKLKNAIDLCNDKIFDYIGGHDADPEISHAIIHLCTNLPIEEKSKDMDDEADREIDCIREIPYTAQVYYFASNYVGQLVTEKLKQNILRKLIEDIKTSLSSGKSDQFLGCCFEQIAHRMLREGGRFKTRSLEPNSCQDEEYCTFTKQENILTFYKVEEIKNTMYYQPEIKNFPSIDALVAPNVLLQMTTSMTHPIKMVGLDMLYDKLAKNEEIKFYFVVPAQLFDHYQKQSFTTTKEENTKRLSRWIRNNVKQYALRIELTSGTPPTAGPSTAGESDESSTAGIPPPPSTAGESDDSSTAGIPPPPSTAGESDDSSTGKQESSTKKPSSSTKRPSSSTKRPSSSTQPKRKRGRPRKK